MIRTAQYNLNGIIERILSGLEGYIEVEEGVLDSTHYVDMPTRTVQPKTVCEHIITTDKLTVTIANLPIPCTLTAHGSRHDVADGIAELSFLHPGTYTLAIESVKTIRWDGEVTL